MSQQKQSSYFPLTSSVEPSFWTKLTELKLEVDKLEEKERHIWGYVFNFNSKINLSLLNLDSTAFNKAPDANDYSIRFSGTLMNKNTIERFKDCNKSNLINEFGKKLLEDIRNGVALKEPALLNKFLLLTFADLKKYHYYYWFTFPVPAALLVQVNSVQSISTVFTEAQTDRICEHFKKLPSEQKPYFLIEATEDTVIHEHKSKLAELTEDNYNDFHFVFHDTSTCPQTPGTMLRNYIVFILHHCKFLQGKDVSFLSLRLASVSGKVICTNSIVFNLKLPTFDGDICEYSSGWTGWEKNNEGRNIPRMANMKATMDPKHLAESAVDLNLKLMKWQLSPLIDLDVIKSTKFLLLGSGTLGCSVTRTLIGWGARKLVFVDNAKVSYSNPVRQSLFTYEDSVSGKSKTVAAADAVRRIFPGIIAESHDLTIPMPSHPVGESVKEQTSSDIDRLIKLVEECDVMFILTDSRESRWFPTLLGCVHNKIVINAALGFDTYLVIRHGANVPVEADVQIPKGFKELKGYQLGCYFCTDVIAPGDSLTDRTLDQQCTVTRPGVSQICGAMAAELAITILQHPLRSNASAFYKCKEDNEVFRENESILGVVPHTIRGYLSAFSHMLPANQRFNQCTACSETVQMEYRENGKEFLFKVFESSKYLTDLLKLDSVLNSEIEVESFSDDDSV